MTKKILFSLIMLCAILSFASCGETKTLHCDGCGKEVSVDASSNMEENWLIFCDECGDIELPLDE